MRHTECYSGLRFVITHTSHDLCWFQWIILNRFQCCQCSCISTRFACIVSCCIVCHPRKSTKCLIHLLFIHRIGWLFRRTYTGNAMATHIQIRINGHIGWGIAILTVESHRWRTTTRTGNGRDTGQIRIHRIVNNTIIGCIFGNLNITITFEVKSCR